MNSSYAPLFKTFKFNNGMTVKNRLAMSPISKLTAEPDGTPSEKDISFFKKRNRFGQLLITGSTTVSPYIQSDPNQLSFDSDKKIVRFSSLAKVMKENNSKAIVQIQHTGRESRYGFLRTGISYAPSSINFPFLPYVPKKLKDVEIWTIIDDFVSTARRVKAAGFDGVEIHGGNHYLIQQFFSSYSNLRNDEWGGTLEKRMRFAIEVVKAVIKEVRDEHFVVGYRISPEEIHGNIIGYNLDETVVLVDKLVDLGIDYLHTSISNRKKEKLYKATPMNSSKYYGISINKVIKKTINGRIALIVSGSIQNEVEMLDALEYGDIIGMARKALSEPEYTQIIESKFINESEKYKTLLI